MMDFSKIKKLFIGGVELKQLFIESSCKNWVAYSTESDGKTIYNGGLGYKSGYRVRSGGAEAALDSASCTGFIPVSPGDVVRVAGCKWGTTYGSAFNVYTPGPTLRGQIAGDGSNYDQFYTGYAWADYGKDTVVQKENYYQWTVPAVSAQGGSYATYIRVTGAVSDGSKLIVTVNEEIGMKQVWKSGYKNWVKNSTESDGVTIYNGQGYIDGYRLSSSGDLKAQANTVTSGFIKASKNDVIRMAGTKWNEDNGYNYFCMYDGNFKLLGYINFDGTGSAATKGWSYANMTTLNIDKTYIYVENGITQFDIVLNGNNDFEYIRISAFGNGADMIVTVNEEIT